MRAIEYHAPSSLKETTALLAEKGQSARMFAGGTDMIPQLNAGLWKVDHVVDVKQVPETNVIAYTHDKGLVLGSSVPCHIIYNNQAVLRNYSGLIDSVSMIGGIQIQGRATLGGNMCNGAPSADGIPPLIVMNAVCVIAGPSGARRVPADQFCTGPRKTVLESGEFLVHFEIPAPKPNSGTHYLRFIPRNEMDIAIAGVGAGVELDSTNSKIVSARIALASVAPTPLLAKEAGESLEGGEVSPEAIENAALLAKEASRPINDMRGTVKQRKHLVYVLTKRALNGAINRAKGE